MVHALGDTLEVCPFKSTWPLGIPLLAHPRQEIRGAVSVLEGNIGLKNGRVDSES